LRSRKNLTTKDEPAREEKDFIYCGAGAGDGVSGFCARTVPTPAVLPVAGRDGKDQPGLLYVYLYPAQTKAGIYPLGGDVRYLSPRDT
jgi:hypothetical protein